MKGKISLGICLSILQGVSVFFFAIFLHDVFSHQNPHQVFDKENYDFLVTSLALFLACLAINIANIVACYVDKPESGERMFFFGIVGVVGVMLVILPFTGIGKLSMGQTHINEWVDGALVLGVVATFFYRFRLHPKAKAEEAAAKAKAPVAEESLVEA